MPVDTMPRKEIPCALCAHDFVLHDLIDLNGYPLCRSCLEHVAKTVGSKDVRRLVKVRDGKMVAGVCGGLARYANFDPTAMRILFFIITLMTGGVSAGIYIIAAFVMPTEA